MMHVGLGRKHPLNVEYIHLGACLGYIQDILNEAILSHPRLHIQRKIALVKALNKVIWVQNDLMAKWHVKDGAEYETPDSEIEIESEGYLNGKKVFSDEDMKEPTGSEASPERSSCPFSGVPASGIPVKHVDFKEAT